MFNFEHTKLTQTQFEKLKQLPTQFKKLYATSKFDVFQFENHLNKTTETDFNSTLLDDGTIFSSYTVNTLIDLGDNDQNNNQSNNNNTNNNSTTNTTDSTHIYQNHQHRQPVNSTELTQNSDPLNTNMPILPNLNTPLPRLNRQNSAHFNTDILFLITQPNLHMGLIKIFKLFHNN